LDGLTSNNFLMTNATNQGVSNSGWTCEVHNTNNGESNIHFTHSTHGMHLRCDNSSTSGYLVEGYDGGAVFKIRGGDGRSTFASHLGVNQGHNDSYPLIVNGSVYLNGSDWLRTEGSTGWYNQSHGGGIYMEDSTWVRIYNGKQFYVSSSSSSAIHTAGGGDFTGQVQATRYQDRDYTGYTFIDGDYCEIGGYFTMGRRHSGTPGTFRPYNIANMARHSAYVDVVRSGGNKDRATVRFYDGTTLKYGTGLLYAGGGVNDYYYIAYNKDTTYENNNKFYMTTTGACYSSSWSTHSDRTIKKNIEPLNMGLDVVTKMRGVTFDYIDQQEGKNDGRQVGVIAQEVQESGAGLAVTMGDNDTLYVDYGKIVPYLIEAIKELKNEIEELKKWQ